MKVKKKLQRMKKRWRKRKGEYLFLRRAAAVALGLMLVIGVFAVAAAVGNNTKKQVFAASDGSNLPTGIAGVVSGVQETPAPGSMIKRIGTSCEDVVVGQRVNRVQDNVTLIDLSASMKASVENLNREADSLASHPKLMSDTDYDTLLRIVEAEAGTEDLKGRILVANVIMNRVSHEEFPDSVTDVVWQYSDGVPQFSPTYDGSIYEVTISDLTREAVKQVLEGVDYSEGALFFIQKSASESHNITWFESDLKKLFKHGVHEFYTYPEEGEIIEKEKTSEPEIIEMVKK